MRITESKLRKIIRSIIAEGPYDEGMNAMRNASQAKFKIIEKYFNEKCHDQGIDREDFFDLCLDKCEDKNIKINMEPGYDFLNCDIFRRSVEECCDEACKDLS